MNDWIIKILDDIKKGSAIQFVATVFVIVCLTGYEVSRGLSPITTTAILYWDGGFTEEELERSRLHGLCDNMSNWPMSAFAKADKALKDKCALLKRRHMLRTSEDWINYQRKARQLRASKNAADQLKKERVEGFTNPGFKESSVKMTPKEKGLEEGRPP